MSRCVKMLEGRSAGRFGALARMRGRHGRITCTKRHTHPKACVLREKRRTQQARSREEIVDVTPVKRVAAKVAPAPAAATKPGLLGKFTKLFGKFTKLFTRKSGRGS